MNVVEREVLTQNIKELVDTLAYANPAPPALYLAVLDGARHWAQGPDIGAQVQRIAIEHGAAFIELILPTDTPRYSENLPMQFRLGYGPITATVYGYIKYVTRERP